MGEGCGLTLCHNPKSWFQQRALSRASIRNKERPPNWAVFLIQMDKYCDVFRIIDFSIDEEYSQIGADVSVLSFRELAPLKPDCGKENEMQLIIRPGTTMSWRDFVLNEPSYSIALDGYVPQGPRFNPQGPWANFNHHEEVSRLETRATCAQVLIALRMGLMQTFDPEKLGMYVNDCDEDVCLSVFLLREHKRTSVHTDYRLNRLVFMEDMLDTTGGAYAFADNATAFHELLWVFEPYHQFRASGELYRLDPAAYGAVIDTVGDRIRSYLAGDGNILEPDLRFKEIDRHDDLIMVQEIGANARLGVFGSGIQYFISARELPGNRYAYTLARASQFVPFPIPKIVKALNTEEVHWWSGMVESMPEGDWGGSDMIAGSPRQGSVLSQDTVMRTVYDCMRG